MRSQCVWVVCYILTSLFYLSIGERSLKSLLDTCADKVRQVDAIPDKLVDYGGATFTWSTAKSSIRKLIKSAGVAGFCEFASQWRSMLLSEPHLAVRPEPFAPSTGRFWSAIDKVDEVLKPIVDQVKLANLSGAVQPDDASSSTVSPSRSTASFSTSHQLSPAAFALATGAPPTPASSVSTLSTLGPSASQVSSSASSSRGSLLESLEFEGNGVWFTAPYERR